MNSMIARAALVTVVSLNLSLNTSQVAGEPITAVALSGDQVPGAAAGVVFRFSGGAMLNNSGQVAFQSQLTGSGVNFNSDRGIYSEGSGTLIQVARTGDQAPDAEVGTVFSNLLYAPVFNASGQTAFRAQLTGLDVDSSNRAGIYSEGGGTLTKVARTSDQAPDAATDVVFNDFRDPVLNALGQTAFIGQLTGPGVNASNARGIYSEGGGMLAKVARTGDQAPDAPAGVVFSTLRDPVLNDIGQTAFVGILTGSGKPINSDHGVYSDRGGTLIKVVRTGDQAPDVAVGIVFSSLSDPVLNASGQTAFRGVLDGPSVNSSNGSVIYSEGSGTLALVAREGDQAPDTAPGVVFNGFGSPMLNASGQTAFGGIVTGPGVSGSNDRVIYSEHGGTLSKVAREGDQVPDAATGVVFNGLGGPALNALGQIAFQSQLAGLGGVVVDASNNFGIYATDLDGLLVEVIRKGDLIDVNNDPLIDDLRTVDSLSLFTGTGNVDGRRSSFFNDLGQIAFSASFTDGSSGVFISNAVAIPEPASALLLVLGSPLLIRRRMGG